MPTGKKLSKKGGSLASDAVVNAVPKAAFPKLDAMFDNKVGGVKLCKVCGKAHALKKCGGKGALVNYNGQLTTPNMLPTSSSPSHTVPVGGNKRGAQLRHISHFTDGSTYSLRNRMIGGEDQKILALGLNYDSAIKAASSHAGPEVKASLSPNDVLSELNLSSLPAPMTKTTSFGAVTDGTGTPFKYGGAMVKKIMADAAAKHSKKKSAKTVKKIANKPKKTKK